MPENKIIDKVQKILAKSVNNTSEAEAQTALLMAQKLMAEHGLTMEDVTPEEKPEKEVVKESANDYGKHTWWEKRLSFTIANNFRCTSYNLRRHNSSMIMFIGLKQDVEIAKQVFKYALDALKYHSKKYVENFVNNFIQRRGYKPTTTTGVKNDYITGFIDGLSNKFKTQVEQNGWALILVKDEAVIEAVEGLKLKKARTSTFQSSGSADAYSKGYERGKSFEPAAGAIK